MNSKKVTCLNSVILANILSQNPSTMLTIAGFFAYPDPLTPIDIHSHASQLDTLGRLTATLGQLQGYAKAYGKYTSGPFAGQYKLQSPDVEYDTSYTSDQMPQQQAHTKLMWQTVKGYSSFLGMIWYEPWYCRFDWEGGKASLCHVISIDGNNGEVPTDTLKTWGNAAVSPWKWRRMLEKNLLLMCRTTQFVEHVNIECEQRFNCILLYFFVRPLLLISSRAT